MSKYWVQVWLYTRYFFKVAWDNLGLLLYTVALPLVFMVLNMHALFFKPLTLSGFMSNVMAFIAWIIFSNLLMVMADIAMLREQGYLKQYASLVVNPTVFIVSKLLVCLGQLVVILGLVGIACGIVFQLSIVGLVLRLWGVLALTTLPILGYCLPLLSLPVRYKTLNAVVNSILIIVMVAFSAVANLFNFSVANLALNVLNPVYLVLNCFNLLINGNWGHFLPAYLAAFIALGLVGVISYRHLKLLPTEGL